MDYKNLLEHPESVKFIPLKDVVTLVETINLDELTPQMKGVALEALKVESQYKKVKNAIRDLRDKLLCEEDPWVSDEEFNDIESHYFTPEKNMHEFQLNFLHFENFIKKIRLTELRKMIEHKAELVIDENFAKNYPRAARFVRKMMLDNINFTMFGKVEQVHSHLLIEKVEGQPKSKMTTFMYFNTRPMEKIKQNKIAELIDNGGKLYTVKEIYQSCEVFETLAQIEKRLIKLKVPIYFGTVICGDK